MGLEIELLERIAVAVERLATLPTRPTAGRPRRAGLAPRVEIARQWLLKAFRGRAEWPSVDLIAAARQSGIHRSSIFEAKQLLGGIVCTRRTGEPGYPRWYWSVPADWGGLKKDNEADSAC